MEDVEREIRRKAPARTLGERLEAARTERGLSIHTLADLSGVSYETIRKLEVGLQRNPTVRVLGALARVLRVPAADLIEAGVRSAGASAKKRRKVG